MVITLEGAASSAGTETADSSAAGASSSGLNLTFSAERGSHRIAVRLDIFAGIIEANLGTAGFAHILIRNGFRGPPGDLDGENALTVANATREVFLADFKLFHVITSHI